MSGGVDGVPGHAGYYAVFTLMALLQIISAAIALTIFVRIVSVSRKIVDRALTSLGAGYLVMSISLLVGFAASLLSLLYPLNPSLGMVEGPRYMGRYHTGLGPHGPWPGDRFGLSWNLILVSSAFYPIAYALILLGMATEYKKIAGRDIRGSGWKSLGILIAPGLGLSIVSDALSIIILSGITLLARKGGGRVSPYIVFLLAHILRLIGEKLVFPPLFIAGEILRPIALLIVLVEVVIR